MTVQDALQSVSLYPVPARTLTGIAAKRGLDLTAEASFTAKAYILAEADVLMWLALAPDVSQGGQNYGFTDEQRTQLRNRAKALYAEAGSATDAASGTVYGYKGSKL